MSAVPLAPAGLALGATASPALAITPVMALFRAHEALSARFDAAESEEEADALYDEIIDVSLLMEEMPATTLADLAAKVLVLTSTDGVTAYAEDLRSECEALVAGEVA